MRDEDVHRTGLFNCKRTGVKLTASKLNLLYFVFNGSTPISLPLAFVGKGNPNR